MSTKVGFTAESHSLPFAKDSAYDKGKKEKFWEKNIDQRCVSVCWTSAWFWDQVRTSYTPSQEIPQMSDADHHHSFLITCDLSTAAHICAFTASSSDNSNFKRILVTIGIQVWSCFRGFPPKWLCRKILPINFFMLTCWYKKSHQVLYQVFSF